jgi:hypothetical protein|tara:strand:- start:1736 stop:1960 length:225 start_codon:yes stop_codon:yes gene_type:complete
VFSLAATAVELTPATLAAFERYVRLTEFRIDAERSTPDAFLRTDREPDEARAARSSSSGCRASMRVRKSNCRMA